jgi:hypothetical protein
LSIAATPFVGIECYESLADPSQEMWDGHPPPKRSRAHHSPSVVDDDGTAMADNDAEAAAGIGPEVRGKGMVHGNYHGSPV